MSEWVKTPPTESGWYWYNHNRNVQDNNTVVFFAHGKVMHPATLFALDISEMDGEWWTTKIEEPK